MMLVGTVGNILTIIVIPKCSSLSSKPMSVYLVALAFVDTLILDFGLLDFILYVKGIDLRDQHVVTCKFVWFFISFLAQVSAWILASMSIERFTAVFFPLKAKVMFTRRRALWTLVFTTSAVVIFQSVHIWGRSLQTFISNATHNENMTIYLYCGPKEQYHHYLVAVMPWLEFTFTSALPFVIMLVTSIAIVRQIIVRNKQRKYQQRHLSSRSINVTKTTRVLLALCFTFLALGGPLAILCAIVNGVSEGTIAMSESVYQKFLNAFYLSNFIFYLNYVANFYLYCLASKPFRKELLKMLGLEQWFCERGRTCLPG